MEVRLLKSDVYLGLEPWSDEKERENYVKRLKNDTDMEETFREYMICILTAKEKFVPSNKTSKRKQEIPIHEHDDDCSSEEEDDPQYAMFLQNLDEHDKSYVLKHNVNGSCVLIKYEEESDSDEDSDPVRPCGPSNRKPVRENKSGHGLGPQRKLRPREPSNLNPDRENESSQGLDPRRKSRPRGNQTPGRENESGQGQQRPRKIGKTVRRSQRKCVNTAPEENMEDIRCSDDLTPMPNDVDYSLFLQNLKDDGDNPVFMDGRHAIVYEKDGTDVRSVKPENDDGNSGLKISDGDPDCDNGNLSPTENVREESSPEVQFNFRKELIRILRRPYDRKEYDRLCQNLRVCKPVSKHKELRDGRDVEYLTDKAGKSLLESHSDFERALSRFENDEPRSLNLMRGFFFWLEHLPLEGSFMPWMDPLCLAMEPKLQPPPSPQWKIQTSKMKQCM